MLSWQALLTHVPEIGGLNHGGGNNWLIKGAQYGGLSLRCHRVTVCQDVKIRWTSERSYSCKLESFKGNKWGSQVTLVQTTTSTTLIIIHRIKLGLMCILFIELCKCSINSEHAFWKMKIKLKMALKKNWAGKLQLHFIPRNYAPFG